MMGRTMINVPMNVLAPLLGLVMPGWLVAGALVLKRGIGFASSGLPFMGAVPTLCAAQYWRSGALVRLWLPLLCMALFAVHPVGGQAWVYSLYWLIPVAIYLSSSRSFFMHALACTFVQHAVGSVFYLYCLPSAPALWYGLLPVVALERLVSASGMVSVAWVVQRCARMYQGRQQPAAIRNS